VFEFPSFNLFLQTEGLGTFHTVSYLQLLLLMINLQFFQAVHCIPHTHTLGYCTPA